MWHTYVAITFIFGKVNEYVEEEISLDKGNGGVSEPNFHVVTLARLL